MSGDMLLDLSEKQLAANHFSITRKIYVKTISLARRHWQMEGDSTMDGAIRKCEEP